MDNDLLAPGNGLIYMKVGTHAQESLEDIYVRKKKEIEKVGYTLWGYGGNTCHPSTMVQPFAKSFEQKGQTIHLFMEPMESSHWAPPVVANQYSADGIEWKDIHRAIEVRGSRFALAIKKLQKKDIELPLQATAVAIGNCTGRPGDLYVKGRVDKACLEVVETPTIPNIERKPAKIGLVAELVSPYAVYLKGER